MTITEWELKAIEARALVASPGPWRAAPMVSRVIYDAQRKIIGTIDMERPEDSALALCAREDVPRLVAEVRRLRGVIKWLDGNDDD